MLAGLLPLAAILAVTAHFGSIQRDTTLESLSEVGGEPVPSNAQPVLSDEELSRAFNQIAHGVAGPVASVPLQAKAKPQRSELLTMDQRDPWSKQWRTAAYSDMLSAPDGAPRMLMLRGGVASTNAFMPWTADRAGHFARKISLSTPVGSAVIGPPLSLLAPQRDAAVLVGNSASSLRTTPAGDAKLAAASVPVDAPAKAKALALRNRVAMASLSQTVYAGKDWGIAYDVSGPEPLSARQMQFGAFPSLDMGGVAIDARVPDDQPEEAAVAAPPDSASQLSSELAYPAAAVPAVQADVVIEPVEPAAAATPASPSQLSAPITVGTLASDPERFRLTSGQQGAAAQLNLRAQSEAIERAQYRGHFPWDVQHRNRLFGATSAMSDYAPDAMTTAGAAAIEAPNQHLNGEEGSAFEAALQAYAG